MKRNFFVKYFLDCKIMYVIIIVIWVFFVFVCSLFLYGWGIIEFSGKFIDCIMGWYVKDIFYIIFLLMVVIFIIMSIIIYCYFIIFRFVR